MPDEVGSSQGHEAIEPHSEATEARLQELADLARSAPDEIGRHLEGLSLRDQAELALRLPPRERLEVLLHSPKPMRLVRTLPHVEFYLTVREVGPADALPLVAMASAPQLVHLLDLESWRGDVFDSKRSGAWLALLLESGEPTLRRFLRDADDELLVLLFKNWSRVTQIEFEDSPDRSGHGETESGTESGFVSPDGNHRFSPVIPEHAPAIRRFAEIFMADHPERYNRVLWSAMWELPSEIEEQALRWRQSRLEEHGFPPWDEAIDVYAPPSGNPTHPAPPEAESDDAVAAPRLPLREIAVRDPLMFALDGLPDDDRERMLHELISVANRLLVADGVDPGDPEAHRASVRKAVGYVGIALAARHAAEGSGAARAVREVPLIELFREGYGTATALQAQARQRVTEGWASSHARALELLDAPIRASLSGLLQPRPLFHDAAAQGPAAAFREFRSPGDLEETRAAVRMAEVLGRVMIDALGLEVEGIFRGLEDPGLEPPRFSTVFLTALAWHAVRGEVSIAPLPRDVLAHFLRTVASNRTADPEAASRAVGPFVEQLASDVGLAPDEVATMHAFGRACVAKLKEECGGLDPGAPPDPRHMSCLFIETK
jgi:hypothetical protein